MGRLYKETEKEKEEEKKHHGDPSVTVSATLRAITPTFNPRTLEQ